MSLLEWAAARLHDLGWLASKIDWQATLDAVLAAYQAWHGLEPSGKLDPATQRHLAQPRFCKHPDVMQLTLEQTARRTPATWAWLGPTLPTLPDSSVLRAIQGSFDAWSAVAGCTAAQGTTSPDIVIATGPIDGPYGVLGETELPGPARQRMLIDGAERWIIQLGTLSGGLAQIDLQRVLTHELGHFWGVGHIGSGNLMAPLYSPAIDKPQPGDIQEMQRRYGPPGSTSQPPLSPPPVPGVTTDMILTDATGNVTARYGLTRKG